MALFKVNRGNKANLPSKLTDGWAYFCTDTGSFLIDHYDSTNTLVRSKVNAEYADKLRYVEDGETVELNPSDIATHTYVLSEIASSVTKVKDELQANIDGKSDTGHTHTVTDITDLTVTATELNYMESVTSNVQAQLDGKAASSHTHSYLPLSGGTLDGELRIQGYDDDYLKLRADINTVSIASVDGTNNATLVIGVNKSTTEKLRLTTLENGTLKQYKIYGEHNPPTASVTTAEYNTMSANNELNESTLYVLTDDTSEEDLQATVDDMNNIDYDTYLAFDTTEIV